MSAADGWMPLWIGDYLADTMHLSGPQHGAYLLLLMHSWRNGPLPDDDRQLAAIARTEMAAWRKDVGAVVRAFFTKTDAGLVQGRLERERQDAVSNAERRTEAARTAANKRWNRSAPDVPGACAEHAEGNASRMPDAMPGECPTPSPLPSAPSVRRSPLTPPPGGGGGNPRPSGWKGQWRGTRAAGENPRSVAEVLKASAPPPPEPDHPLWPKLRAKGMKPHDFRTWIAPLIEVVSPDGRPVLIAPSAFHASHVRSNFAVALEHATGQPVEIRAKPEAATA